MTFKKSSKIFQKKQKKMQTWTNVLCKDKNKNDQSPKRINYHFHFQIQTQKVSCNQKKKKQINQKITGKKKHK